MRWFFHDFNDPRFRYSRICTRRKHSGFIHITLFSSPIESVLAHFHWFVCRNHWYSMAHNLSMNQYKCLNNAYDRCDFAFRSSYMCASLVMCTSFQRFNSIVFANIPLSAFIYFATCLSVTFICFLWAQQRKRLLASQCLRVDGKEQRIRHLFHGRVILLAKYRRRTPFITVIVYDES